MGMQFHLFHKATGTLSKTKGTFTIRSPSELPSPTSIMLPHSPVGRFRGLTLPALALSWLQSLARSGLSPHKSAEEPPPQANGYKTYQA